MTCVYIVVYTQGLGAYGTGVCTTYIWELPRRDKYQRKLVEYWVDVKTTGLREQETSEQLQERISREGKAPDQFEMGGFGDDPLPDAAGELGDDSSDDDDDDNDGGKPRRRRRSQGNDGFRRERALEAQDTYMWLSCQRLMI